MSKNAIILGVGLQDNVTKQLQQLSGRLRASGRNMVSVGDALTAGVTIPVALAGAALLKFAGDLDATKKALSVVMGSTAAAEAEFQKLKKSAEVPGMGLQEALKGSLNLQALGANADQARYMLEGLAKANALSGGGAFEFGSIVLQFQQMVGNGKLLQEDLKWMFQRAPALRGVVQDIFGTSDPAALRGMTTTSEFVTKLINKLHEIPGVGDSVKNSLENIWTSMKIGAGQIGLAILGVDNWDQGLSNLSHTIDDSVKSITDFIENNRELTKGLIYTFGIMAATGPLVKLIGNLKLLSSFALSAITPMYKMAASVSAATQSFIAGKFGATALVGSIGLFAVTIGILNTELSKISNQKLWDDIQDRTNKGLSTMLQRIQAGVAGLSQLLFTFNYSGAFKNFDVAANGATPMGAFTPKIPKSPYAGLGSADRSGIKAAAFSADFIHNAPGGGSDKAAKDAQDAYEEQIKLQRAMAEMFANSPVKSRYEIPSDLGAGMKGIKPGSTGFTQTDTKIAQQYAAALTNIAAQQSIGADSASVMGMQVDAAKSAYLGMVDAYGLGYEGAEQYRVALQGLTAQQEAFSQQQEATAKAMEYAQIAIGGVLDGIESLVTEGKKGFEAFGKSVLKAVGSIIKMVVAQLILKAVSTLGIFSPVAIPAIAASIPVFGGLIGKVPSFANGGILTGESLIRAGEYQGVSSNPEVIAPLNKLKGMMGGGSMEFTLVQRGEDLLYATSIAQSKGKRRGSGNTIR